MSLHPNFYIIQIQHLPWTPNTPWKQQAGVTTNNRMTGLNTSTLQLLPLTPQLHTPRGTRHTIDSFSARIQRWSVKCVLCWCQGDKCEPALPLTIPEYLHPDNLSNTASARVYPQTVVDNL